MTRRNLDLTLDFLKSLDRSVSTADILKLLNRHLRRFGIEHYMAGAVYGPRARPRDQLTQAPLATMPREWKHRYMAQGYLLKDPTMRLLGLARAPFTWGEALHQAGNDDVSRRVLSEAADFGMADGVTVPLLTLDGEMAGFSFSGARIEMAPSERDLLQVIATYAFAQLLLIRNAELGLDTVTLSPREREALQWTAEGKTAWEIGSVMGISEKGVEYHLRAVRSKLGAVNSIQSVAIALRFGLIN